MMFLYSLMKNLVIGLLIIKGEKETLTTNTHTRTRT
jgi:hypothetical protein